MMMMNPIIMISLLALTNALPIVVDDPDHLLINGVSSFDSRQKAISPKEIVPLDQVPVGETLDLFYRYGFFSLSMRVVSRPDFGTWLVREPTAKIFDDNSYEKTSRVLSNRFESQLQLDLCEDKDALEKAFFSAFSADGVAKTHRLFTGSWHEKTMAKYLGLSVDTLKSDEDKAYLLLRLGKPRLSVTVNRAEMRLKSDVREFVDNMGVGEHDKVLEFVQNFGSHMIEEMILGENLYQIIVLSRDRFDKLRGEYRAKEVLSNDDFELLAKLYLDGKQVLEEGQVMAASGDPQVSQLVSQVGLVQLMKDQELINKLDDLAVNNVAVVGMNMGSLSSVIEDQGVRQYFEEVLQSHHSLWEANV